MAQCDWTMTKSWRAWAGAADSLTRGNFEDSCSNYNSDSWAPCIASQNVAQCLKHLEPIQAIKHLWSMHAKRAATATIDHKLQVVYQKKYKIHIHGTHTPLESYPSLCTWCYYASQPFIWPEMGLVSSCSTSSAVLQGKDHSSHYCILPLCASEDQGPHTITQLAWLGKPLTSPARRAKSCPCNRKQTLRSTYSITTIVSFILSFCFIYFPTSFIHVLWPLFCPKKKLS